MRLTVVGCSGSLAGPDSAASSYLVSADDHHLVLDLGSGALGPLQRHLGVDRIGAVALSHLHPDHCLDVCGLYVACKYSPHRPPRRIPVFGPAGTAQHLARAFGLPEDPGMSAVLDFVEWQPAQRIGPFTVRTARMAHPVPTYAIRVEHAGRVLVYSGDTGPTDALVGLARGADVLLAEAAFRDADSGNPPALHLTGGQAGEHAARAEVGRLIVTHVPPWFDPRSQVADARAAFAGDVVAARAGDSYQV